MLDIEGTPDDDIKTRTRNIMDDILARIEGPKQSATGVRGTWWAAYNGFNEYLNYAKGRTEDNRLDSLWFGLNANDNIKALNKAVEFANAIWQHGRKPVIVSCCYGSTYDPAAAAISS